MKELEMASNPPSQWRVVLASQSRYSEDLHSLLWSEADWSDGISVALESPGTRFRMADPAVLVATIAAASSALAALLTGILQRGVVKAGRRIVIEFASGAKLEVPADIDPGELDRMIDRLTESPQRILLP